ASSVARSIGSRGEPAPTPSPSSAPCARSCAGSAAPWSPGEPGPGSAPAPDCCQPGPGAAVERSDGEDPPSVGVDVAPAAVRPPRDIHLPEHLATAGAEKADDQHSDQYQEDQA